MAKFTLEFLINVLSLIDALGEEFFKNLINVLGGFSYRYINSYTTNKCTIDILFGQT